MPVSVVLYRYSEGETLCGVPRFWGLMSVDVDQVAISKLSLFYQGTVAMILVCLVK
jgi:hypothetical protein